MKAVLLWMIRFYRRFLSPLRPPCCRFIPTCSAYALEAVEKYGAFLPCAASCAATPFIGRRASSMTPSPDGGATAIPGGQAAGTPSHLEALQ